MKTQNQKSEKRFFTLCDSSSNCGQYLTDMGRGRNSETFCPLTVFENENEAKKAAKELGEWAYVQEISK
jgi:hypothetical protein